MLSDVWIGFCLHYDQIFGIQCMITEYYRLDATHQSCKRKY